MHMERQTVWTLVGQFTEVCLIRVCAVRFDLFVRGVRNLAVYTNHNTPESRQSDLVTHEAFL